MEEPNFTLKYNVGDIVTDADEESIMFRRDCLIVHSDPLFIAVISKGIPQISYFNTEAPQLRLLKKGPGKLTPEDTERLNAMIKTWPDLEFVQSLPQYIEKQQNEDDKKYSELMRISLVGEVPKSLVISWRRFNALITMAQNAGFEMPKNVDSWIVSWMILATVRHLPYIRVLKQIQKNNPDMFRQMFGDDGPTIL